MIDIGANLTHGLFNDDMEEILKNSSKNNTNTILITGTTYDNSIEAINLINKYDNMYGVKLYSTVGVHPHNAKYYDDITHNNIKNLIQSNINTNIVAVGECGLDYDRLFSDKESQIKCFNKQIDLAYELEKPLFLHERLAHDDFVQILKDNKNKIHNMVVHCFTGNRKELEEYLSLGAYIGITGWICNNKRNKDLLEAIKHIPMEKLMIETDAPFLLPIYGKGARRNEPANLIHIAKKISNVLNVSIDKVVDQTVQNSKKFFDI
jgi:TatD DNase family protein